MSELAKRLKDRTLVLVDRGLHLGRSARKLSSLIWRAAETAQRKIELEATLEERERNIQALSGQRDALLKRAADLEKHNGELTIAATERAQKVHDLEHKLTVRDDLDYQILMAHQQLMAGLKDADARFIEIYDRCKPFTMTSVERLYALYKSIEYIVERNIGGDLAETGVWKGGSCMLMAETLIAFGDRSRKIFLFDTFEGHPMPDREKDVDLWGNRAFADWEPKQTSLESSDWGRVSIDEVKANLARTGYPMDNLVFFKGMVERTVPEASIVEKLALLRLDTDWYQSTKISLEHFYPKVADGGVLIVDDYGHYKGQKIAVDEYFQVNGSVPLLVRVDYSCRVAVKTPAPSA